MALQSQLIPFAFDAGIDQEFDAQVLSPGAGMGVVENGVFRRLGRIEKRLPLADPLDRTIVVEDPGGGAGFTNERSHTLLPTGNSLAVQAAATQRAFNESGAELESGAPQHTAEVERIDIWYKQLQATVLDSTVVNGFIVSVYSTEGLIIVRVVEIATGQVVLSENVVGSVVEERAQCRVERAGDLALVFATNLENNGTDKYDLFHLFKVDLSDASNITIDTGTILTPDPAYTTPLILPLPYVFDTTHDDAGNVYLIYNEGSPNFLWIIKSFDSTGVETNSVTLAPASASSNIGAPAIYAAGNLTHVFFILQSGDGLSPNAVAPTMLRYTRGLAFSAGPLSLLNPSTAVPPSDGNGLYRAMGMVISDTTTTPRIVVCLDAFFEQMRVLEVDFGLTGFVDQDGAPGTLVSKPHYQRDGTSTRIYPVFTIQKPKSYTSGQLDATDNEELDAQPNILLVAWYGTALLASIDPAPYLNILAFGRYDVLDAVTDSYMSNFPSAVAMTEGEEASRSIETWHLPYLVRGSPSNKLIDNAGATPPDYTMVFQSGCASVRLDYTLTLPLARTELGDAVYTGGACLQSFAGDKFIRESSFHWRPIIWPSEVATLAGGGSLGVGDYTYVATFERFDGNGDLIRSEISRSIVVTVAADERVRVVVFDPLYFTGTASAPDNQIRVKFFRSDVDGAIPKFLAEFRGAGNSGIPGGIFSRLTLTDAAPDSDLIDIAPYPFAQQGLQNNPTPAPYHHTEWANRMVIVNGQDRDELWISNIKGADPAGNRLGLEFSGTLTLRVAAGPGDIEAVASIDEKLIIFKPDSIYMTVGEGPNAGGIGGTFRQPVERSSQVGCINKRSVITTEVGVFFQSRGGIQLLDRGMQISFVGHNVTDILPGTSVGGTTLVKRVTLISELKEVRFLLDDADQTVLCYHYRFKRWSVLKYFDIATRNMSAFNFLIADIATYRGIFHALVVDATSNLTTVYKETDQALYADAQTVATPVNYEGTNYFQTLTTPDFKLANLTGFQRLKNVRFLMDYAAAHDLQIEIAYNEDGANFIAHTFDDADIVSTDTTSYVVRIKPGQGKSRTIRFRLRDQAPALSTPSTGAGFRAVQLSLEAALKRGGFRIGAVNKR